MRTQRHLNDPDTNVAAMELLSNATVLAVAGYAGEAHSLLLLLLENPAWKVHRHGPVAGTLQGMSPVISVEHDWMAECTLALPLLAGRDYAVGLVDYDRWFLHERP